VLGSEPPAAAAAEPPPPPPPPAVAVEVAFILAVAVDVAEAEAEAALMFTSRPAAMLWKHASTWFSSTPSSCARAAAFCWLSVLY
jgi:hypothetical protein